MDETTKYLIKRGVRLRRYRTAAFLLSALGGFLSLLAGLSLANSAIDGVADKSYGELFFVGAGFGVICLTLAIGWQVQLNNTRIDIAMSYPGEVRSYLLAALGRNPDAYPDVERMYASHKIANDLMNNYIATLGSRRATAK
ncbi:hypothetical protein HJC99_06515 [Candidatus Saccharibacteria bacterium]|nr:hypothetical protein [Candidatus Saccharibacteria bacterium]